MVYLSIAQNFKKHLWTSVYGCFWKVRSLRVSFFVKFQEVWRQLFYIYFPVNPSNSVIFENASYRMFLKMYLQTKSNSKSTTKKPRDCFSWCYLGVFTINLAHFFDVCEAVCFYWSFRSFLYMSEKEYVTKSIFRAMTGSVFGIASGLSYQWQWKSLW